RLHRLVALLAHVDRLELLLRRLLLEARRPRGRGLRLRRLLPLPARPLDAPRRPGALAPLGGACGVRHLDAVARRLVVLRAGLHRALLGLLRRPRPALAALRRPRLDRGGGGPPPAHLQPPPALPDQVTP